MDLVLTNLYGSYLNAAIKWTDETGPGTVMGSTIVVLNGRIFKGEVTVMNQDYLAEK